MRATTSNQILVEWVDHWTEVLGPDTVHWCDGTEAEYDALAAGMVASGTFSRLNDDLRPNSYLALSDPEDAASQMACTAAALRAREIRAIQFYFPLG